MNYSYSWANKSLHWISTTLRSVKTSELKRYMYNKNQLMKLLNEKDEISLKNRFISVRLVKEVLEKIFTIQVVEERSGYVKFRIIRWARLYGFPFIWFQASLEIWINNENDKLIYEFFWPEYLALIFPFIMFIVIEEQLRDFILFFVFAIVFFGFLMFLDTRWVSRKVRKAFESM